MKPGNQVTLGTGITPGAGQTFVIPLEVYAAVDQSNNLDTSEATTAKGLAKIDVTYP